MAIQNEIDRIAQNVANTYAALQALGADMPEQQTSDNLSTTAGTAKVVLYIVQTLTEDQQAQARTNIGAAAEPIISTTDITAGSAASSGRPYHVIE